MRSADVKNVQKTPSKGQDRKSSNDPRNNRLNGSVPSKTSVKKTADQSQNQDTAESQQSQMSKFSQVFTGRIHQSSRKEGVIIQI